MTFNLVSQYNDESRLNAIANIDGINTKNTNPFDEINRICQVILSRGLELVIVIAIIGILSAVAIPKFIKLSSNAQTAATSAVAGALASASANNYAARKTSAAL